MREAGADPASDLGCSDRAGGVADSDGAIGGGGLSYSVFFVSLQSLGRDCPEVE